MRKGKHHSRYLQRAFKKYGEEGFKWFVIEKVKNKERLLEREQYWINKLRPHLRDNGYNLSPTAGNNAGSKFYQSAEFKEKHRQKAIRMGFGHGKKPPRTRQHSINQGKTKAKLSEETANSIRASVASGERQKDLAVRYGLSQQTISNIVRDRGVVYGGISRKDYKPTQKRTTITDEMRQQIIKSYNAGATQVVIAASHGITQAAVSQILKRDRAR